MPVPRVELEDVEAMIPLTVGPQGRVSGLTEYVGRRVLVIVPADDADHSTSGRKRSRKGAVES